MNQPKTQSIVTYINKSAVKDNIQKTLGEKTSQFIASMASLVSVNPKLAMCNQKSLLSACLVAATLDLPINQNLGFAYIIPYRDQAQFQMGYKGFVQLAMRSNQFLRLNTTDVREGELIDQDRLSGDIEFEWIKKDRHKTNITGYVAYMRLKNGFSKQLYMDMEQLNKHASKFSMSFKKGYGLWKDDLDAMCKKTVLKLMLSKYAPMTVEMQKAQLADQSIIDGEKYKYIDNEPIDPKKEADERERNRIIKHIKDSNTPEKLKLCKEALKDQDEHVNKLYKSKLTWFKANK